jgi:hypothetical protein
VTARHIRIAGVIVLFAGLGAAATIYFTAQSDEKLGILGIDIRTNRQRGQMERMGGKGYVMLSDFDEWFAGLWHGRRLGSTVGVLSLLGFLLSRGLARVHEDHQRDVASEARAQSEQSSSRPTKSFGSEMRHSPNPNWPNKAPEPTTMAVTSRAPSSTSHGRGSS